MSVFFAFFALQVMILLVFSVKYFLRTKDYNSLIPIGTAMTAITILFWVGLQQSGTNNLVELILLILGIIVPIGFMFLDKPMFKKRMFWSRKDIKNKALEAPLISNHELFLLSPEKEVGLIVKSLRGKDFLKHLETRLHCAQKQIENGNLEEAAKIYEQYHHVVENPWIRFNYANILHKLGKYSEAVLIYQDGLRIFETEQSFKKSKKHNQDIQASQVNLQSDIQLNMANAYYMMGKTQESLNLYQKIMNRDGDCQAALDNYIQVLVNTKNFDEAVRCCKTLCAQGPNYKYHFMLARIYFELNKPEKCIRELQKSLHLKGNHRGSLALLAEVYSSQGQTEEAIEVFYKLIKVFPEDAAVHYSLGKLLETIGNYHEAIEQFNLCIALNPDMFEAYYNIGLAYERIGNMLEAVRTFKKLTEMKPDFISAYTKLWEINSRENKFQEIIDICKTGVDKLPNEYILYFYMGVAFSKMGRYEEALLAFKTVLDINPDLQGVNLYLGITLTKLQKYEEAIQMFRSALLISPQDNEIFYNMSITYCLQARYDKAIGSLKKAVELNPDIKHKLEDNLIFACLKDSKEYQVLSK